MELKELPDVVARILSQWLETSDLLSLISTSVEIRDLFSYRPYWLLRAKQCGIYRTEFEALDSSAIKAHLVAHLRALYREIRTICPVSKAKLLTTMLMEDNAKELELQIVQTAKKSATALLPIAMQFGRVRIMHSLLTHYNVSGIYHWLIHAIRYGQYAAVRYLVEVRKVPLTTDEPFAMLASVNRLWDSSYSIIDTSGRRHRSTFCHYNELLLREIIRCRHPMIVRYLKGLINELLENDTMAAPDRYLVTLMNRHSVDLSELTPECPEPDLSRVMATL